MAEFYSFKGLKDGGTFKVDSDTASKVSADPQQLCGRAVAVTGDGEVGYGSSGDAILGVVETVEKESTNSNTLVVGVLWNRSFEDVPYNSAPTAGDRVDVDGNGGVAKGDSGRGIVLAVDSASSTCTILM